MVRGPKPNMRYRRVFVAVVEVETEDPKYDKTSMATWIDAALREDGGRVIDVSVYDTLPELLADHRDEKARAIDPLLRKLDA